MLENVCQVSYRCKKGIGMGSALEDGPKGLLMRAMGFKCEQTPKLMPMGLLLLAEVLLDWKRETSPGRETLSYT